MFPIGERGLGFGPKGAGFHWHVGVERDGSGLFIVKTIESVDGRSKGHSPSVHVSNQELRRGLAELFEAIRSNEIDPTHPRFSEWIVLIPKPAALNPDSPLSEQLLGYRNGEMKVTSDGLNLDMFLEMFYVVNLTDITRRPQRRFRWALAYPSDDWRSWEGNMWWLRSWAGCFYLISDNEQSRIMRRSFKPALDKLEHFSTETGQT